MYLDTHSQEKYWMKQVTQAEKDWMEEITYGRKKRKTIDVNII